MNLDDFQIKFFKALGHPIRLGIVKMLLDGEKCVCKIQENIEFSQSNLSQHLKILKDSGILRSEKKGLNVHYSIRRDEIGDIIALVEDFVKKDIFEMTKEII